MRKLRVGVWLGKGYVSQPEAGGGHGYYHQIIDKIKAHHFKDAEIIFLSNEAIPFDCKSKHVINWRVYTEPKKNRLINFLERKFRYEKIKKIREEKIKENRQNLKDELNRYVDVIYYPVPICEFTEFPFIYTLWDLGHVSTYAFPEVSMNHVFEGRKYNHDYITHKALMVFAESNAGKKDIVKYLGINEERIKVVPLFSSEIVNEKVNSEKPNALENELFFIHYPAQYWAHKNHFNLMLAFKNVLEKYPSLKLVLTGSDKGNKAYITERIKEVNLEDSIIDLGFVSNEELKWLYSNSQGLVMPTFLGPTNMPLLEAAELGCPVACSKLDGHIEQLGDYGYYFDPKNPESISDGICAMLSDKANNVERSYKSIFNIDNAIVAIDNAFSELNHIRFCWGEKDEIY